MSLFEGVKKDLQFSHQDSMGFQGWLNNETRENSRSCKFCSEPAGYSDFAEAPFEERKRLVDIRNSVKEVDNMFVILQVNMPLNIISSSFSLLLLLWIGQFVHPQILFNIWLSACREWVLGSRWIGMQPSPSWKKAE